MIAYKQLPEASADDRIWTGAVTTSLLYPGTRPDWLDVPKTAYKGLARETGSRYDSTTLLPGGVTVSIGNGSISGWYDLRSAEGRGSYGAAIGVNDALKGARTLANVLVGEALDPLGPRLVSCSPTDMQGRFSDVVRPWRLSTPASGIGHLGKDLDPVHYRLMSEATKLVNLVTATGLISMNPESGGVVFDPSSANSTTVDEGYIGRIPLFSDVRPPLVGTYLPSVSGHPLGFAGSKREWLSFAIEPNQDPRTVEFSASVLDMTLNIAGTLAPKNVKSLATELTRVVSVGAKMDPRLIADEPECLMSTLKPGLDALLSSSELTPLTPLAAAQRDGVYRYISNLPSTLGPLHTAAQDFVRHEVSNRAARAVLNNWMRFTHGANSGHPLSTIIAGISDQGLALPEFIRSGGQLHSTERATARQKVVEEIPGCGTLTVRPGLLSITVPSGLLCYNFGGPDDSRYSSHTYGKRQ